MHAYYGLGNIWKYICIGCHGKIKNPCQPTAQEATDLETSEGSTVTPGGTSAHDCTPGSLEKKQTFGFASHRGTLASPSWLAFDVMLLFITLMF